MGREEGSGWGTHLYLWQIHFDIWQNQYNIVKLNKIKLKKKRISRVSLIARSLKYNVIIRRISHYLCHIL